jgi:DNA-binding response OmpR family regulator
MLEHLGYRTIQARDGAEALSLFQEHRGEIDAVLLDISMPKMDGIRCFEEIRRIDSGVPVLFLTAHGAENYQERLEEAGAFAVLNKPIELMVLGNRMRRAMGKTES